MVIGGFCFDLCRGKDAVGEEVIKPYTPITLDSDVGYFELVIKVYDVYCNVQVSLLEMEKYS